MNKQNEANYIVQLNDKTFLSFEGSVFDRTYAVEKEIEDAQKFYEYSDAKKYADDLGGTVMTLDYVVKKVEDTNEQSKN